MKVSFVCRLFLSHADGDAYFPVGTRSLDYVWTHLSNEAGTLSNNISHVTQEVSFKPIHSAPTNTHVHSRFPSNKPPRRGKGHALYHSKG